VNAISRRLFHWRVNLSTRSLHDSSNPPQTEKPGLHFKHWLQQEVHTAAAIVVPRRSTKHIFSSQSGNSFTDSFPALGKLNSYMRCMIRDSSYKTESLNDTLKVSFGEQTRMFDYSEPGVSQCKLAVTTTTTSTAATRIVTNYNGTTVPKSDCGALVYCQLNLTRPDWLTKVGYTSVRPEEPKSEPLVWQA